MVRDYEIVSDATFNDKGCDEQVLHVMEVIKESMTDNASHNKSFLYDVIVSCFLTFQHHYKQRAAAELIKTLLGRTSLAHNITKKILC